MPVVRDETHERVARTVTSRTRAMQDSPPSTLRLRYPDPAGNGISGTPPRARPRLGLSPSDASNPLPRPALPDVGLNPTGPLPGNDALNPRMRRTFPPGAGSLDSTSLLTGGHGCAATLDTEMGCSALLCADACGTRDPASRHPVSGISFLRGAHETGRCRVCRCPAVHFLCARARVSRRVASRLGQHCGASVSHRRP